MVHANRFVAEVKAKLAKLPESLARLRTSKEINEAKTNFVRKEKISLLTECGWFDSPGFEVFLMTPKDELHAILLGLVGEHIFSAIMYRYMQELQRPDLQKPVGKITSGRTTPFFSQAQIKAVWKRLTARLEACTSEETMLQVTPKFTSSFLEMYMNQKSGITLTGDRIRMLQLLLPFMLRDLIFPEVPMIHLKKKTWS